MLSADELRIWKASLRAAQDQIQEIEAALGAVSPRTSDLAERLSRLKEIRHLIEDERRIVAAQLEAAK